MISIIYFLTVQWFKVLLFNISNSTYQVFPCNINNLHTVVWFQIIIIIIIIIMKSGKKTNNKRNRAAK